MHFGEKIKTLREKKLLTRGKFADALGIKYSTLSNYENGVRQPDFDTLKLIARFFSVSIDYLLEDANENRITSDNENLKMVDNIEQREEIKLLIAEGSKVSSEDLKMVINLLKRMNKNDE